MAEGGAGGPRRSRLAIGPGLEFEIVDWGGEGPAALLHHASGFCAGVWRRIALELRRSYRVIGFDARGHGESSKPELPYTWQVFGDDLVAITERLTAELGCERIALGVGHSLGGTAMLLAAGRAPRLFGRLVLLDPVLITADLAERSRVRADGSTAASLTTRMRQARFASRAEALALFRSQPLYAQWDAGVLEDYAREGLRELADGQVALKCPPHIEASIYAQGETRGAFDPPAMPVLLLSARGSRFRECHERFAAGAPMVELRSTDAGHLMPMEQPLEIAQSIAAFAAAGCAKGEQGTDRRS